MGKKYSINSAGRIVAERDIYSLGGFIPKGRLGGSIKDETQLSQDGECWLAGGSIATRPDIVIKDNAYIGDFFVNDSPVHTDGVMEFSGNTKILGYITIRCPQADPKNNVLVKDSFIGVSMDVLFGVSSKCHPVEQGQYNKDAPKGTLFTSSSMKLDAANCVRNTATIRLGKDTYLYTPAGYNARVFWAYYDASNQLAFSGETLAVSQSLTKLAHPVYKLCMVFFAKSPTLTPAELEASGAKILGHISGSLLMDLRPESVSGEYVMDNSSFIMPTNNFGLATTQLRFLAGGLYNTNMYTPTNRQDYKPYGTFRNVERLEYGKYLGDSWRNHVNRDTCISAYDCPLLRIGENTYDAGIIDAGDLILRRCIVPKGCFRNDVINGNTYEDLDFSYANEDLEYNMPGYTNFISSHREGIYRLQGGTSTLGFASRKGNLAATARLFQAEEYIPLDGDIIEQGAYTTGPGKYYEDSKIADPNRVRTTKPIATFGIVFPSLPTGFSVKAVYYLDDGFILRSTVLDPSTIEQTYPYVVMTFRHNDDSAITASEFIALNRTLRIIDHTKAPEILGSSYVGEGCTVRGDVQLIGDPYVNRVFDVNLWEVGTTQDGVIADMTTWDFRKVETGAGNRFRFVDTFEVEPGGTFTCDDGYLIHLYRFDGNGDYIGQAGWAKSQFIPEGGTRFAGLIIKKTTSVSDAGGFITEEDLPLANVKYIRAFKERRYITNELDRKSPEDILIGPDYWEQGTAGGGQADAGKTYEELKATSGTTIRLKRPINVFPSSSISTATGFVRFIRVLDAATKFHLGEPLNSAKMALLAAIIQKDPSAATIPSDITNARLVLEFVPQPRIVAPYGASGVFITGMKVRMYDNAVLSKNLNTPEELILKGDAVVSHLPGGCICGWGDSDAIVKL